MERGFLYKDHSVTGNEVEEIYRKSIGGGLGTVGLLDLAKKGKKKARETVTKTKAYFNHPMERVWFDHLPEGRKDEVRGASEAAFQARIDALQRKGSSLMGPALQAAKHEALEKAISEHCRISMLRWLGNGDMTRASSSLKAYQEEMVARQHRSNLAKIPQYQEEAEKSAVKSSCLHDGCVKRGVCKAEALHKLGKARARAGEAAMEVERIEEELQDAEDPTSSEEGEGETL